MIMVTIWSSTTSSTWPSAAAAAAASLLSRWSRSWSDHHRDPPQQQEQSPSKMKVKRKTRKSLSRTTPLKERNDIVPNKTVPTLEHSGSKRYCPLQKKKWKIKTEEIFLIPWKYRYRRSSKMSSLIAEATDTDDQSPVLSIYQHHAWLTSSPTSPF